jgi:hypothetical protein
MTLDAMSVDGPFHAELANVDHAGTKKLGFFAAIKRRG